MKPRRHWLETQKQPARQPPQETSHAPAFSFNESAPMPYLSLFRQPVRALSPCALACAALVAACGGSPSTSTTSSSSSVSSAASFPTGLAVGSPTDLSTASSLTASASDLSGARFARDWGRALWQAVLDSKPYQMGRLAAAALPLGIAHAAPAMVPDLKVSASRVEKILSGSTSTPLGSVLVLEDLFADGGNASCYGPSLAYRLHEDAGGGIASGTLPGGDLGLWLQYEGTQPCVSAQLSRRVAGVKGRSLQGLLLMAALRRTIEASSTLAMPRAGGSTDVTTAFATMLHTVPAFAGITVYAASVALDSAGTTYTYRLAMGNGATDATARSGEIVMRHSPGSSETAYSGVMQIAGFSLTNDAAMGCSDLTDSGTGLMQGAQVTTLKYSRSGATVAFASRSGNYCGAPSSTASTAWGADVASFTSDGQLDPSVKLSGPVRGGNKGWRANFSRFAGNFDKDSVAGNFLYAWQAGTGDNHSRAMAVNTDYNSATETRSMKGYFAFASDIATTDGSLLGMICNWAGPGNSHTPQLRFQSQTASLGSTDMNFVIPSGGNKITYAPTNSCSSITTEYDVNVDHTISAAEGAGTTANLDVPSGINTVQQELTARGFTKPTMF
jgi:hypothetical protein